MQFRSGYVLEPVKESLKRLSDIVDESDKKSFDLKIQGLLDQLTRFDVFSKFNLSTPESPNSILSVAYNLVTRGTPTLASPFVEEYFSQRLGLTERLLKDSEWKIKYIPLSNLSDEQVFRALHPIDANYNDRRKHLDFSALGSNFEKDFLLNYIPEERSSLAFIFDAQRERKSLGAAASNQGRVDFSLEIPYFVVDTRQSIFRKEVEVKNRKKFIVEVDGRRYHEQLIDDQKDFEIAQLGTNVKHIREGFVYDDVTQLVESLKSSDYLELIDQNFKSNHQELNLHYAAVLGPMGVARVQQVLLKYLLNSTAKKNIRVAILERDLACGEAAILDLQALLDHLFELSGQGGEFFKLTHDVYRSSHSTNYFFGNADEFKALETLDPSEYDLVIDISLLSRSGVIRYPEQPSGDNFIVIRNAHFSDQESSNPIISAECIVYRDLVEVLPNEQFKEIPEAKKPLVYFLNVLFRMVDFRPGQLPILNRAFQLKSVIGLLPTGGGKSLTYHFASLLQPGITVVVDPIKSLMKDQYDELHLIGITRIAFLNSELGTAERNFVVKSLENGSEQFVFLSPERYVIDSFRESLKRANEKGNYFSYVVIDEVHCVSEWGHNFRTPYLDLGKNAIEHTKTKTGKDIPLIGLTATASYDVLADIERELKIKENDGYALVRYENTVRDEINYRILEAPVNFEGKHLNSKNVRNSVGEQKQHKTLEWLQNIENELIKYNTNSFLNAVTAQSYDIFYPESQKTATDYGQGRLEYQTKQGKNLTLEEENFIMEVMNYQIAAVVFCPHKNGSHGVYPMATFLRENLPSAAVGTFSGSDNKSVAAESFHNQELFKANKLSVMVATKAFGMGINKPNVRTTVHVNVPESIESFVQEAGRAGRDRALSLSMVMINRDRPLVFKNDDSSSGELVECWSDLEILEYFHNLSFKGKLKERQTLFELRNKIIFPNIRQINLLEFRINAVLGGGKVSLKVGSGMHSGSVFVNDLDTESGLGKVDLESLNTMNYSYAGNLDSRYVLTLLKNLLQETGISGSYALKSWLNQYTVQSESLTGVEKMLSKMNVGDEDTLQIPFRNKFFYSREDGKLIPNKDHISAILENELISSLIKDGLISPTKVESTLLKIIDSNGDDLEFLEELTKSCENETELLNMDTKDADLAKRMETLRRVFYLPRSEEDTAKGMYRLLTVGVIDTYTIDYQNKIYEVRFKKKENGGYYDCLKELISRYTSEKEAEKRIDELAKEFKVRIELGLSTEISACLEYLTDFIYDRIADKRKRAIKDMLDLCLNVVDEHDPIQQNLAVKEYIYYYFNAKYSRKGNMARILVSQDEIELPASLIDEMDVPYHEVIRKYIGFLVNDLTASFKDNLKHLRGATMRMLRDRPLPSFLILKAFTLLVLSDTNRNLIDEGLKELLNGFLQWKKEDVDADIIMEMDFIFKEIVRHVKNEEIHVQLEELRVNFQLIYYSNWIGDFKNKFLNNYQNVE